MPKSAPRGWSTFRAPSTGSGAFEDRVMLLTTSWGRGLWVGKLLFGWVGTNGWEKLVSEPLISGTYPLNRVVGESKVSTIHTVLDDTPHGCNVTPSSLNAVAATPRHRPESTPNGAYSFSNAKSFGKPCGCVLLWQG